MVKNGGEYQSLRVKNGENEEPVFFPEAISNILNFADNTRRRGG